ncbi:hypothetical protein [Achromobacter dolens]|uniref:hypothetical protein n=1 Tax=Achromobacter dolens TaxID=1287738 RepID=UPI0031D2E2FC
MSRDPWPEVAGVAVVMFGTVLCIRGWPSLTGADGQALAAWTQAVVTVAGIGAAWYLARHERIQDRRDAAVTQCEEQVAKIEAVLRLADRQQKTVLEICRFLSGAEARPTVYLADCLSSWRRSLSASDDALIRVPLHEVPYAGLAFSLQEFRMAAADFMGEIGEVDRSERDVNSTLPELREAAHADHFDAIARAFRRFRDDCYEEIDRIRLIAGWPK